MADALVGDVGCGKTTAASRIISSARSSGIRVFGILSPRLIQSGKRVGYDIVDVSTQTTAPWLILDPARPDIGPFRIIPEGAALAKRALAIGLEAERGILVIDEVGPLELRGEGHGWALARLSACKAEHILIAVRQELTGRVDERWGLTLRCWKPREWRTLASTYRLQTPYV